MANPTKPDEESKKASAYWGYLFQRNKCPTDKLERLLRGIAACISDNFEPMDAFDLRPEQLAAFYRRVGGDYDILFTQMPSQSIAFVYKSLGCLHSLQPSPAEENDGYASPTVPALKPRGFVTWQTIQLLLGPEEHVPFIQNALKEFPVIDPATQQPFPNMLPSDCLPSKPDPDMVAWHQGVSDRLRLEADNAEEKLAIASQDDKETAGPEDASVPSGDERTDAARYFSNPHYRNRDGRPAIVRSFTRAAPKVRQEVMQSGKAVALTVRNIANPYLWSTESDRDSPRERTRRRSRDGRISSHDRDSSPAHTPSSQRPFSSRASSFHHSHVTSHSHSSPHDHQRRHDPPRRPSHTRRSSSKSSDDHRRRHEIRSQSGNRRVPRHYKSHEPASSAREYFGHWDRPARSSGRGDRSESKHDVRHRRADHRRPSEDRSYSHGQHHEGRGSGHRTYSSNSSRPRPRFDDHTYSDDGSRPNHTQKVPMSYFPSDESPFHPYSSSSTSRHDHPIYHRRSSVPHIATPTAPDTPNRDSPTSAGAPPRSRPISGSSTVRFTDPFRGAETPPRRSSTSGVPESVPVPVPVPTSSSAMSPAAATAATVPAPPQSRSLPGPSPPVPFADATAEVGSSENEERRRPQAHRYVTPVGGVKGRRYPNESIWR